MMMDGDTDDCDFAAAAAAAGSSSTGDFTRSDAAATVTLPEATRQLPPASGTATRALFTTST